MANRYGFVSMCLTWALILGLSTGVFAATTGKIAGVVRDRETGDGLPGVNVLVEGTKLGTSTDAEGHYFILLVKPGTASVTASMIGYHSETKQEVQIIADYTTTIDFSLGEEALEMDEMVVVATRPPVEPDKTTSKHVVTIEDIQAVPMVRNTRQLIALQPGMALDGSNRIRGSESRATVGTVVGYYVDGIEVGRGGFNDVNLSAVQEVSVLTGGMNAEFGNALAGVVTVVTREGGREFSGMGDYRFTPSGQQHWGENLYQSPLHLDHMKWDDQAWLNERDPETGALVHEQTDYTGYTGHRLESTFSGPLASEDISFFFSTTYNRSVSRFPNAEPATPFNTQNLLTVTHQSTDNVKLKLGGLYERNKRLYSPGNMAGAIKGTSQGGRNIFLPLGFSSSGKNLLQSHLAYLAITHSLNTRTYYELRLYHTGSSRDSSDVPAVTGPIWTDQDGWFYLPRQIHAFNIGSDQRYGLKFDITSQVNRSHLMQAGFELKGNNVWSTNVRFGPQPENRNITFVGKDYEMGEGVTPWELNTYIQDKVEFGGFIVNAGLRWDYFNYGRGTRQFPGVEITPMFSKFTNRKYELEFMEGGSPSMSAISPRVGVSHPISDRLAAHYFIGRFHTFPRINDLFSMGYGANNQPDEDLNRNGVIDPTEEFNSMRAINRGGRHASEGMKPEQATSMEMGLDWNFVNDYTATVTAHYRLDEGLYGGQSRTQWEGPVETSAPISVIRNSFWISSRGIEFSLRKSFSNNFTFRLAYDIQFVRGVDNYGLYESNWVVYPDSNYIASGRYWYQWDVQGDGSEVPAPLTDAEIQDLGAKANRIAETWKARTGQPVSTGFYSKPIQINEAGLWVTALGRGGDLEPAGQERRNQFSMTFLYASPPQYGPKLGRIYPFGNLRVSSIHRLIGGTPFEFFPPEQQTEWRESSPALRTDMNIEKDFGLIGPVRPTLYVEITNLFNEQNTSARSFEYVQFGLKGPAPDDPNYLRYGDSFDFVRNRWDPRQVELGLTFRF